MLRTSTSGARSPGRLQVAFKDNVIDYRRMVEHAGEGDYEGWLGVEYVWIDWEQCNECDNLSETILFRDFLRPLLDRPAMGTPVEEES